MGIRIWKSRAGLLSASVVLGVFLWHLAALAGPDPAANPKPTNDSDPFPITVSATPAVVLVAGKSSGRLVISGQTMPAGQRMVSITIKSGTGDAAGGTQIKPDDKGKFSYDAPAPAKAGSYDVTAMAPDGRGVAHATFRAVDAGALGPEAEKASVAATQAAEDAVAAAETKIEEQVDSPPKTAAKKKIAEVRQALKDLHTSESHGALNGTIGAISSDAALMESQRGKFDDVTTAVTATVSETERVKELTSQMSSADIGCHQLAFVTEVFKGISALLNLKKKLLDTTIGFAKDVVSDSAANGAKSKGAGPVSAFVSGQIVKNLPELNSASKLAGNAYSLMADLGAFVSDTLFGQYCEQFAGTVEGIMNAKFFDSHAGNGPTLWWTYNYRITGRVILYYPKSAKGNYPIRLNGRIEGYAHGFETWEDALTVMFPKLMAGAMQYKKYFPPVEAGGTASALASQGSSPMSAYIEGSAAGLAIPNSFLISATGVLEKDSMTVLIGPVKSDISAVHRVTVLILSPLTGGLGPQITWYPLKFSNVDSFLANAANGESMKLPLKTEGDTMTAQNVFTGTAGKVKAHAEYTVKMKVCNPGC